MAKHDDVMLFRGTDEEVTAQLTEQGLTQEQIASVMEQLNAARAEGISTGFLIMDESGKVSVVTK